MTESLREILHVGAQRIAERCAISPHVSDQAIQDFLEGSGWRFTLTALGASTTGL